MAAQRRTAGRVALLDSESSVLLLHEREGVGSRWITPGGGVEPGERPAQAAARELFEETGLRVGLDVATAPWRVDCSLWSIDGVDYEQTNHFFLVRTEECAPPIRPAALTDYERRTGLGSRWWRWYDLAATHEAVVPPLLADWLREVVGAG